MYKGNKMYIQDDPDKGYISDLAKKINKLILEAHKAHPNLNTMVLLADDKMELAAAGYSGRTDNIGDALKDTVIALPEFKDIMDHMVRSASKGMGIEIPDEVTDISVS